MFLVSVIVGVAQSLLVALLHKKLFIFNNFARKTDDLMERCNKIDQFCRLTPIWRPQNLSLEITPLDWIIITGQ